MESSYSQNSYGHLLHSLVRVHQPEICVEVGVLEGYSAKFIARALFENQQGILHAYDIWEDYPYTHCTQKEAEEYLRSYIRTKHVVLKKMDAYSVPFAFQPNSIDFLHIDISNDGDNFRRMLELFHPKIKIGGIVVFEGGSKERDNTWIKEHNKPSLHNEIETNALLSENYQYITIDPWPSITICKKVSNV